MRVKKKKAHSIQILKKRTKRQKIRKRKNIKKIEK